MKQGWILEILAMACLGVGLLTAEEGKKIQDNSFLLEEAYNQEDGVIQHIQFWQYDWKNHGWYYTFTDEWPAPRQAHQLSFTLPVQRISEIHQTGVGDLLLNYRYQLVAKGAIAVAPRLSLVLPTGQYKKGMGNGSVGLQANIPMSIELTDRWVTHWNLGSTYLFKAHDPLGVTHPTWAFNYGASFIYLVSPNLNLMCEIVGGTTQFILGQTLPAAEMEDIVPTAWEDAVIINPAFRYAFNFKSGLQIVTGVGFPIGVGPAKGQSGLIVYLSFEHPMFKVK